MAGWRSLRAVLPNFLKTFVSRYTDYEGWWLFGLAESDLHDLTVDLLALQPLDVCTLRERVSVSAALKFREQCKKHGMPLSSLRSATLVIERLGVRSHICGSFLRKGADYRVKVEVETMHGRRLVRAEQFFVAPHDPSLERRTGRP